VTAQLGETEWLRVRHSVAPLSGGMCTGANGVIYLVLATTMIVAIVRLPSVAVSGLLMPGLPALEIWRLPSVDSVRLTSIGAGHAEYRVWRTSGETSRPAALKRARRTVSRPDQSARFGVACRRL
jgi:hypothetical protein